MRAAFQAAVIVVGVAMAAPTASAHAVGWSIHPEEDAIVLSFTYGGGEPIAFAEVTITAPDGQVYQKGRADRAGKFAVVMPDDGINGDWTAAVVDGEGHSLTARFQVVLAAQLWSRRGDGPQPEG
ncbi:MAG: hypothetical protein MUD11_11735 [Rhodobacteraceae bacterium]|nr:hypothetical protein [Paracoccaceae bacterium]